MDNAEKVFRDRRRYSIFHVKSNSRLKRLSKAGTRKYRLSRLYTGKFMLNEQKSAHRIERRRYERYASLIQTRLDEKSPIKVTMEGVPVQLVDYALGGLYVISKDHLSPGEIVNITIDMGRRKAISLLGRIVRINMEPDREGWGIAIDLAHF